MDEETTQLEQFGARLRLRREQLGLSQDGLGKAIGKSKQHISNWENANNWPDAHSCFILADAIGCDARQLIFGHSRRLTAPIMGFPGTETGAHRLRSRRRAQP